MNMSLIERVKCLLLNDGLSKGFLAERGNLALYLFKTSPHASLKGKLAKEVWTGNPTDLGNSRIF